MNKPKFDPNQTFEAVKPVFDPNAAYNAVEEVPKEEVGQLESMLRGASQGLTLGFGDEIVGGLESAFTDKSYTQARDESRLANEAARAANPATYLGSEVAGSIGASFVPGMGATTIPRLVAMGAVQGLGSSTADLTKGEVLGAAKDTALGAGIAGTIGTAAPYVGKAIKGLGKGLSNVAEGAGEILQNEGSKTLSKAMGIQRGVSNIRAGTDTLFKTPSKIFNTKFMSSVERKISEQTTPISKRTGDIIDYGILPSLAVTGNPGPAAALYVGKKIIQTPIAQKTIAVGLDKIGDILKKTPQFFGKFAPVLKAAELRGGLAITHFLLQQTNPEYQQLTLDKQEEE